MIAIDIEKRSWSAFLGEGAGDEWRALTGCGRTDQEQSSLPVLKERV